MGLGPRQYSGQSRSEAFGESGGVVVIGHEVLPQFDQHVGEASPGAKLIHRVAHQRAVVGLVVADHEVRLASQRLDERNRQPGIDVP